MNIYSDTIESLEQAIISNNNGNIKSQLENCQRIHKWQNMLLEKYNGNTNDKEYQKSTVSVRHATGLNKTQLSRFSRVGQYLIENGESNPDLFTMSSDRIYNKFIKTPKPKAEPKPKPAPQSIDLEYYKACELKYMALMDYMGEKADSILAKALEKRLL